MKKMKAFDDVTRVKSSLRFRVRHSELVSESFATWRYADKPESYRVGMTFGSGTIDLTPAIPINQLVQEIACYLSICQINIKCEK